MRCTLSSRNLEVHFTVRSGHFRTAVEKALFAPNFVTLKLSGQEDDKKKSKCIKKTP